MKKILAIGGSNSKNSINRQFATHIATQVVGAEVITLNWEEIALPLYGVDIQNEIGIPDAAHHFLQLVKDADALVLSVAEHNGMISAALKNLWDWSSRLEQKLWMDKPMFLAATSPGGRGAKSAFDITLKILPHYGGNVVASMSLPLFHDNLKENKIQDPELHQKLTEQLALFTNAM